MTNMKLSSKMHLFIIISSVVVAIGLAVGIICQFVAGGYFNYGAEFKSYNTIEVNYAYVDYSDTDKVVEVCDGVFKSNGVSYYAYVSGDTDDGGRIIFKFAKKNGEEKLVPVAEAVQDALRGSNNDSLSSAAFHNMDAQLNGGKVLKFTSIAIASAIALQLIYFMIRYRITMAFSAFLANIHNLAIYVSLLAITRIPIGISAVAVAALTVLVTMIACGFLFDRYRRNLKNEKHAKLSGDEMTDLCVNESFKSVLYPVVGIAAIAVVLFVLMSISAMSVMSIAAPVVAAIMCVASALYGTVFFVPPVHTRIQSIGDKVKARSKNKKQN